MKSTLYRIKALNSKDITIRRVFSASVRRMKDIPHAIAWYMPFGFAKKNRNKLKLFKDIHKGKRCFIVANGPSLKKIDFDLLKKEFSFGMNRIYLMEKVNGFRPTYLACIDWKSQLLQFTDEYNEQTNLCFYDWNLRHLFDKKENFMFIKGKFSPAFSKDPVKERALLNQYS